MTVMTRIIRLWKADFNGFMDELEDKALLLKQHLREMEEELEKNKVRFEMQEQEKKQLLQKQNRYSLELQEYEKDLKIAVLKEKDDIARMLIKKMKTIRCIIKNLEQHILQLEQNLQKIQEQLSKQQEQYNQLKVRAKEYLVKEQNNRSGFQNNISTFYTSQVEHEPSNEEIELELLKYKERFQTAVQEEQS
jgi:phage shock protein A